MDWAREAVFLLAGVTLGFFQWLMKRSIKANDDAIAHIQKAQEDIDKEVRVIKETYVPKADLRDIKDEIIHRLARIEDHLINKKNV